MRENKFRWFSHVKRNVDIPIRRCEMINIKEHRRDRGRLKKS